jgi:hypothetical protein
VSFTKEQKNALRRVAICPKPANYVEGNKALDDLIDELKRANPHAFLQPHEFINRKFYYKPKPNKNGPIEYESFLKESP